MFDSIALLDFLNSREDAALFWIVVASALALWRLPDLRPQVVVLLRELFGRTLLLRLWVPAALYVGVLVAAAYWAGLWHTYSSKETAYWFLATGLILAGKAIGTHGNPDELRKLVIPALSLTIFVEFFVNAYVFPIAIEIVLLPVLAILVTMSVFTEGQTKYAPAKRAIDWMLGVIGVAMLAYVVLRVMFDLGGFLSRETAERLLVAPIFTIALIPFLYLIAVWSTYEQVFIRLDIYGRDAGSTGRAKWALFRVCRLNLRKIGRISHRLFPVVRSVEPDADVTDLVRRFEGELRAAEKEEREAA